MAEEPTSIEKEAPEGVEPAPSQEATGAEASPPEAKKTEKTSSGVRTLLGAILLVIIGLLLVNLTLIRGCKERAEREDVVAYAQHVSERQSKLVVLSIYQRLTSYHESEWLIAWAGIGRVDESEGEICVDLARAHFRMENDLLTIVLPQPRVDHETIGLQFDKSQTRVFWQRLGCPDAAIQALMHKAEQALTARLEAHIEAMERDELVMQQARMQAEDLLMAFYRQALGPDIQFSLEWEPEADSGIGALQ